MNFSALCAAGLSEGTSFFWKIAIALVTWIIVGLSLNKIGQHLGFGINLSQSQVPGLYMYFPLPRMPRKGEFVDCDRNFLRSIGWLKERDYLKDNEVLLKNIGAVPGDWLFSVYHSIYVCKKNQFTQKCKFLGKCLKKDSYGRAMFCQNWQAVKIPENYFYLQSNRISKSFDSRYFGLVNINNLHHKIKMLMKFDEK